MVKNSKNKGTKNRSHDDLARRQIEKRRCKGVRSGRKKISEQEKAIMIEHVKKFTDCVKEANCMTTDPTATQIQKIFKKLGCPERQCSLNMLNNVFKRNTPKLPSRAMHSYMKKAIDEYPGNRDKLLHNSKDAAQSAALKASSTSGQAAADKKNVVDQKQASLLQFGLCVDKEYKPCSYSTALLDNLSTECLVSDAESLREIYPVVLMKVQQYSKVNRVKKLLKLPDEPDIGDLVKRVKDHIDNLPNVPKENSESDTSIEVEGQSSRQSPSDSEVASQDCVGVSVTSPQVISITNTKSCKGASEHETGIGGSSRKNVDVISIKYSTPSGSEVASQDGAGESSHKTALSSSSESDVAFPHIDRTRKRYIYSSSSDEFSGIETT